MGRITKEKGPHVMSPSHVFPFKAFLRANIVLKRPFHRDVFLKKGLFITMFFVQFNKREAVLYLLL